MKDKRITRLLRLLQTLQSGPGKNVSALAGLFQVNRRTIFRDLKTLRQAGMPLEYDPESERYYVSPTWAMPPTRLTPEEAFALIGLATEFVRSRDVQFYDAAYDAAVKLERTLPKALRQTVRRETRGVRVQSRPLSALDGHASVYRQLVEAIARRNVTRIVYGSLTEWETIETELRPYRLLFSQRSWYVLGRSAMHREVRTFNLARIKSLDVLKRKYVIPKTFSLERHLGNSWRLIPAPDQESHVLIRFAPLVARNVAEVKWHKTQQTKFLPDGSLEFRAHVSGLFEIVWWILGYGDQAEVLRPAKLRRMVAQRVAKMATIYQESD